ncbi:spore cortex biosynthesis protein YabQ [Bacillus sp. JJ634]
MTLTTQFYTLLVMVGMGSFFGAALDTYSRFLKRAERKRWIVFIHDVLFWVIQGLLIFYVLFLVNEGEFRFYLFLALLCGFSAYQALFKNIYQRGLEMLITIVIKLYEFTLKAFHYLLFLPIKWIAVTIFTLCIGIFKLVFVCIKWLGKFILLILRIIFKPLQWILIKLWEMLPDTVTKKVVKFYKKLTGILMKCKNVIKTFFNRWRKEKD